MATPPELPLPSPIFFHRPSRTPRSPNLASIALSESAKSLVFNSERSRLAGPKKYPARMEFLGATVITTVAKPIGRNGTA